MNIFVWITNYDYNILIYDYAIYFFYMLCCMFIYVINYEITLFAYV